MRVPYTPVGGELSHYDPTIIVWTEPSSQRLYSDGKQVSLSAYIINGNNYFKLRDIGQALNFGVDWDGTANMIKIDTSTGYTG